MIIVILYLRFFINCYKKPWIWYMETHRIIVGNVAASVRHLGVTQVFIYVSVMSEQPPKLFTNRIPWSTPPDFHRRIAVCGHTAIHIGPRSRCEFRNSLTVYTIPLI